MRIEAKTTDVSMDDDNLEPRLIQLFEERKIPVGLIYRLLLLTENKLNFLMHDSGDMNQPTDTMISEAHSCVRERLTSIGLNPNNLLTQWQEAESRLHRFIDLFGHVPTKDVVINTTSGKRMLVLSRKGKTADEFIREAHAQVSKFFTRPPFGNSSILSALMKAFSENKEKTMHYLFSAGEPSDDTSLEKSIANVRALIEKRPNPAYSPLELISCTAKSAAWMKEVDQTAPFVGESDDDVSEAAEMRKNHGEGFPIPISQAFLDLCALVAPICPDLDALDESIPLTKFTIENILNKKITDATYRAYWDQNPNAKMFESLYSEFLNTPKLSSADIIAKIKTECGLKADAEIQSQHVARYAESLKRKTSAGKRPDHDVKLSISVRRTDESQPQPSAPPPSPPPYDESEAPSSSALSTSASTSNGVAPYTLFSTGAGFQQRHEAMEPVPAVDQTRVYDVSAEQKSAKEEAPKGCACVIL